MEKVLRKGKEKKICGVCSGIAEYCGADPTIIRLLWAFSVVCFGFGILAYIVAALVMPNAV